MSSQSERLTVQQFVDLESQVWDAFVAGDASADAAVLADNFVGVYSTGFADKQQHCQPLRNGPIAQRYEIQDPRILVLSESLVMLLYLAVWERANVSSGSASQRMYVSSLWQKTNGNWKNVFSQDSVVK